MSTRPVIIVPAVGQSKLVLADKNGNKIKNAWPFELDEKKLLDELKGSLMKMLLFKTDGGFSDKIAGIANDITEPLSVNADGSKKHILLPVIAGKSYAECDETQQKFINGVCPAEVVKKVGAENVFYFDYDFFGDVSEVAGSLDAFVDLVLSKTGAEKADFIVFSTGATILKAYLKDYAVKSQIEKVICVACAFDGASAVADIYENKLNLDNPAALLSALGGKAASLASVVGMLPPEVMNNIITKTMNVLKKNILDNCTSVIALVPAKRYDAVVAGLGMSAELKAKTDAMKVYSENFAFEVKALEEKGMKFSFICGKGKKLPSVFASADVDCDGLVDTCSASLDGAFGENTLYVEDADHFSIMKNDKVRAFIDGNI